MALPFSQFILLRDKSGNLAWLDFFFGYILAVEFCCGVNSVSPAETGAELNQFWCSHF